MKPRSWKFQVLGPAEFFIRADEIAEARGEDLFSSDADRAIEELKEKLARRQGSPLR
jgi:hypothetical protein